jgi:hypothetical protein
MLSPAIFEGGGRLPKNSDGRAGHGSSASRPALALPRKQEMLGIYTIATAIRLKYPENEIIE